MAGYADTIILVSQQFAFLAHKKKSKKHIFVVKITSKNPIWLEATSWLQTSSTEELNLGLPRITSCCSQSGILEWDLIPVRVAGLKYTMLKGWSFITCEGGVGCCSHFEKALKIFKLTPHDPRLL